MTDTVAILGLGLMGRPMARTLQQAGFDVRAWNRSLLAEELVSGLQLCKNFSDVAPADICILMLSDSAAVDLVLPGLEPFLSPGKVVVDMGSSDPTHSVEHARRLAVKGIGWVDAPVSGGPEGAAAGSLAIMVGSDAGDFERVKPIFQVLGDSVVRVGEPGAGHLAKVVNQLIVGLTIEAVAEALTLAEASGIDPRLLQAALRGGFADSKVLQLHGTRMIDREYIPGGKATTQLKDLRLGKKLAETAGLSLPHLQSTVALYEQLVNQGDGELDHSALHKLLWPKKID